MSIIPVQTASPVHGTWLRSHWWPQLHWQQPVCQWTSGTKHCWQEICHQGIHQPGRSEHTLSAAVLSVWRLDGVVVWNWCVEGKGLKQENWLKMKDFYERMAGNLIHICWMCINLDELEDTDLLLLWLIWLLLCAIMKLQKKLPYLLKILILHMCRYLRYILYPFADKDMCGWKPVAVGNSTNKFITSNKREGVARNVAVGNG